MKHKTHETVLLKESWQEGALQDKDTHKHTRSVLSLVQHTLHR